MKPETAGRATGVLGLLVCLMIVDPNSDQLLQRLGLPLLAACCVWLVVRSAIAVLLGVLLLAAAHSHPGSHDWVGAWAYPAITVAALLGLGILSGRRFRRHINATRNARWAPRRPAIQEADDD